MKLLLLELRERLLTSIWFIPALLCLACLALALALLALERDLNQLLPWTTSLAISVTSARQLLGVIAGAVLSVGGVVFSMTMVALTLTSGQYGPKLIRQFLSTQDSKISVGMFMGTSLYCLVSLGGLSDQDQPNLTVVAGLVLTVSALAGFIRFIHRTATDLQADQIIERICGDLRRLFEQLVAEKSFQGRAGDTALWRRHARGKRPVRIASTESGYVQAVDYPALIQWCCERDCFCQLRVRAGDFLLAGGNFAQLYGCSRVPEDEDLRLLRRCVSTGALRTPVQDPEYPITQLNQLAARALSPGINDPGTAITCVDWYTMAVAQIADHQLPGKVFLDNDGQPRLLARQSDFASILDAFYSPLRNLARGETEVILAIYNSLIMLAEATTLPDRLQQLGRQGSNLHRAIPLGDFLEDDLRRIRQRQQKLALITGGRVATR
jgi:uncharacterized membrane protein